MLECYLFALCVGSSLDKDTNAFTLFNLVESVTIPAAFLGQPVAFEMHAHFFVATEARHASFDMRVIRIDAEGREDPGPSLPFQTEELARMRVRARAFRLPLAFGIYTLRLEWKPSGSEAWHAEPLRWPLEVLELKTPPSEPSPAALP